MADDVDEVLGKVVWVLAVVAAEVVRLDVGCMVTVVTVGRVGVGCWAVCTLAAEAPWLLTRLCDSFSCALFAWCSSETWLLDKYAALSCCS